jgi:hypothetical protein
MRYIITNKFNDNLRWSNKDGWTTGENCDFFTQEEKNKLSLPIDGEWAEFTGFNPSDKIVKEIGASIALETQLLDK